jgi:hypothetical protein
VIEESKQLLAGMRAPGDRRTSHAEFR